MTKLKIQESLYDHLRDILGAMEIQCKITWQSSSPIVQADYPRFALTAEQCRQEEINFFTHPFSRLKRAAAMEVFVFIQVHTEIVDPPKDENYDLWLKQVSFVMCRLGAPGSIGDVKYYLQQSMDSLTGLPNKEKLKSTLKSYQKEVKKGKFASTLNLLKKRELLIGREMFGHSAPQKNLFEAINNGANIGINLKALCSEWHLCDSLIKTIESLGQKS